MTKEIVHSDHYRYPFMLYDYDFDYSWNVLNGPDPLTSLYNTMTTWLYM